MVGIDFELAHCNFNLRGKESDQDEFFVKDLAWSIVEIIGNKKTFQKIFNISGSNPLTFKDIIKIISIENKLQLISNGA